MSNENLNLVKNLYETYNRRESAENIFAPFSPEIEIVQTPELPWGGKYKGFNEAFKFFSKLVANVDSRLEIEEMVASGETVTVIGRTRGIVRKNVKPFDVRAIHVLTLVNGKIIRAEYYIDTPAMLAALQ